MESLLGYTLPFQRRLTKMYTDTKSSYDFVKEPVSTITEDPELLSLHRKLRIQKDRLVSWGLEWSDSSTQSPDIDESISKAGLSELVGSVMTTIKEVLAEAEPLWQSSKRVSGSDEKGASAGTGEKAPLISWDKSRFQDLVRDLTMSIDTLYDLSRTRQSARRKGALKSEAAASGQLKSPAMLEERLFESTRMQTPRQIDPNTIIWPKDLKSVSGSHLQQTGSHREIVFMKRPVVGRGERRGSSAPIVPVLLERAPYDPIYSITGIAPSMTRFERLFSALSQAFISSDRTLSGLLPLIGYFEEPEESRFSLLFSLPTNFGPVDIESPSIPTITTLGSLLTHRGYEPPLEIKFRLSYNVANAVFDLHAKGVVHGDVNSSNILFLDQSPSKSSVDITQVNIRRSYLSSFDLFSDSATQDTESTVEKPLYRHPLDPRNTRYTHFTSDSKSLDLYSLAIILLEIGFWAPLREIFPGMPTIPENTSSLFQQLALRCGSLYSKAVQACWHAPEDELSAKARPDVMHQKIFSRVSRALDTCCALDDISEEEQGEHKDIMVPSPVSAPVRPLSEEKLPIVTSSLPRTQLKDERRVDTLERKDISASIPPPSKALQQPASRPKLRTFPSIRIGQEHLNYWHSYLMPQINHVLGGFYKRHPESVEISLESIGETAMQARPTILVICTSVNKVRSILKKSLVYDKATYGLKVCRGKVVRSRKQSTKRSVAHESYGELGEMKALNPDHQMRPLNGASIGAYVNDKHLPPVSFGGLIEVDGQPYGMTVHHLLDDPDEGDEEELEPQPLIHRSSASRTQHTDLMPDLNPSDSSAYSDSDDYHFEFSDYDSDDATSEVESSISEEDFSVFGDDNESFLYHSHEPGDIPGVPPGFGEEYIITQPAIDDVDPNFYASDETKDEEHLDCFTLGEIYATSGIRRRADSSGLLHEIDWALFRFNDDRLPERNEIKNGSRFCKTKAPYPLAVAPIEDLPDMPVHCMARTSGLQSGRILPAMVTVKIYGRQTPSVSFQVAGRLGVPGDSGAWVVDNESGRAAGHVLAWSARKKVAYICPMEVLLKDIGESVGADMVGFPGGDPVWVAEEKEKSGKRVSSTFASSSHPGSHPHGGSGDAGGATSIPHILSASATIPESLPAAAACNVPYVLGGNSGDLVGSMDRLQLSEGLFSQG
ncbi:hypothetical protein F5884DRAFT_448822 [Xylogone sp. PMI_703]|nr:hypothetical protein F5884DRAFT_448822 [Xylogone sp. PMI_703]